MNDPEETILSLLEENWALEDNLASSKLKFHRLGWRIAGSLHVLQVVAKFGGGGGSREQPSDEYFNVPMDIGLITFPASRDVIDDNKGYIWQMVEEVKRIIDATHGGSIDMPSDWKDCWVTGYMNRDNEEQIPPIISRHITINIKFYWSPS